MKKLFWIFISPFFFVIPAIADTAFEPGVRKLVPLVEKQLDLDLMLAGSAESRLRRAQELAASLKALSKLNPLTDASEVLNWVGVLAMLESVAVQSGAEEVGQRRLLSLYRDLMAQRENFSVYWRSMRFVALQPGAEKHPSVQLAEQIYRLPTYLHQAIRWLAGREPMEKRSAEFRRELLAALAQVEKDENNWDKLLEAARACCREKEQEDCLGWQAEALFERDRPQDASVVLGRLPGGKTESISKREQLYHLRQKLAGGKASAGDLRQAARLLLELNEPSRVFKLIRREEALAAADSELDELYLEAFFQDGLRLEEGWDFARRARSTPGARFLARRITLGLAQFLDRIFHQRRPESSVTSLLEQDLAAFRKFDAPPADLMAIYLKLVEYAVTAEKNPAKLSPVLQQVKVFRGAYPARPEGPQLLALLAHLGVAQIDPWEEVKNFLDSDDGSRFGAELALVLAGAAAGKALRDRQGKHLSVAIKHLEKVTDKNSQAGLWRAHLLVLSGLLGGEPGTSFLNQAASAYLDYVQKRPAAPGRNDDLCDAVLNLATLAMQAKEPGQALDLLRQARGPCADDSSLAGALSVLELVAADKREDVGRLLASLAANAATMDNQRAQLQALLWLALGMEAVDQKDEAQKAFRKAAQIYRELEASGQKVYLAPEALSLVGLFGALDVQVGFASDSPFALAVDLGLRYRLQLFPPAAADLRRLQPYLK